MNNNRMKYKIKFEIDKEIQESEWMILDEEMVDEANDAGDDQEALEEIYDECEPQCSFLYTEGDYTIIVEDENGNVVWTSNELNAGVPMQHVINEGSYLVAHECYNGGELEGEFEADSFDFNKLKTVYTGNSDVIPDTTPLNLLWYDDERVDTDYSLSDGDGKEFSVVSAELASKEDYMENCDIEPDEFDEEDFELNRMTTDYM